MPCFKGLSISIHTADGVSPEYSIQRQFKHSRITSYIPVPPARVRPDSLSNKPEQPTFAISITLLTPGQHVPYVNHKAQSPGSSPKPQIVGELPDYGKERGKYESVVKPYSPLTASSNETVAAYIYFDGRSKEEVATLLRRGEETWVNSRWVSIPVSEGGGLAEREFLFREVGLEKWLNGLDLGGKDSAARIGRRRERIERRRRFRRRGKADQTGDEGDMEMDRKGTHESDGSDDLLPTLHKPDRQSDGEDLSYSSDSDSDPPLPEAAGQIKIALFRVLASGEIKRGEYSPQFGAHDDDEDAGHGRSLDNGKANGRNGEPAEIDHTTSFAKPKALDPKSISTQTVTGIDGPEKPYAVFTFFYRSERQLQKMGILAGPKPEDTPKPASNKRRSLQADLAKLPPLNPEPVVSFPGFRDPNSSSPPANQRVKGKIRRKGSEDSDDDEPEDIGIVDKLDDVGAEDKTESIRMLSPEDAERQRELAEGLRKIKLKRAHSAEPLEDNGPRKSSSMSNPPTASHTPTISDNMAATPPTSDNNYSTSLSGGDGQVPNDAIIGSPLKKSRPSLANADDDAMRRRLGLGLMGGSEEMFPPLTYGEEFNANVKGKEKEENSTRT